jgi:hypothetical protein
MVLSIMDEEMSAAWLRKDYAEEAVGGLGQAGGQAVA